MTRLGTMKFIWRPGLRWIASSGAVAAAWAVLSPSWLGTFGIHHSDLSASDKSVMMSLGDAHYRYDFVPEGKVPPECPGPSCPLNPLNDGRLLRREAAPFSNIIAASTKDGWRGTMFMRWDITTPEFVKKVGDAVAFDFYGIAGKSFRFFVDGVLVESGRGGPSQSAIVFDPHKLSGTPMTVGFEIIVGRTLAPGLITVSEPFLSPPSIVENLRDSYRGRDRLAMIPIATGFALIAILAGFGCFFTPFYREILAFSIFVTLYNWRQLLVNDMSVFPSFLNVDFVTVAGVLKCGTVAALWAFSGLYFRIKSRLLWTPVIAYILLAILCYGAGRFGIGLELPLYLNRSFDFSYALAFATNSFYAFESWRQTQNKPWAIFRHNVAIAIGIISAFLCVGFAIRYWVENLGLTSDTFGVYAQFYAWMRASLQFFVIVMGLVIALEWSLIVGHRQRVLQRFGTIVDPRLMNDILHGSKGQSRRIDPITVLFSDLRSFTKMCEVFDPDLVTRALNEYLDVVTSAVQAHGGVVDKFVGDAVMALWGVPEKGAQDSLSAVRAAIDVRIGMANLNQRRLSEGLFQLDFGIGIHCGSAIFGAIGNGIRVDHTVIGPTVNVASRLQGLTKRLQCDIVISNDVYQNVKPQALVDDLGMSVIRGMSKEVHIVKLIGIQMNDELFAIGSKILEDATTLRQAGVMEHSPTNVLVEDYGVHESEAQQNLKQVG